MTMPPLYESRILEMSLEKYAEIAVDGGLWLVGELLAQGIPMSGVFVPDPSYVYKPRHLEAAIIELFCASEELRHRIFFAGFLKLPHNGAQETFKRLLVTHGEMLHEALRMEWKRHHARMIDVNKTHGTTAINVLHKLALPR
jgi:hypothetical protein